MENAPAFTKCWNVLDNSKVDQFEETIACQNNSESAELGCVNF